jgi:hypothetical protein
MNHVATIQKISLNDHFTMMSNEVLEDFSLSWGAKGLLGYLLSRPKDWIIYTCQLAEIYKGDRRGNGKDGIYAMIRELKQAGFISYSKSQDKQGKWNHSYTVYPMPMKDFQKMFPERVKPELVQPSTVKPDISNKKNYNKKEEVVLCSAPPVSASPAVPERWEKIEKVDCKGQKFSLRVDDLYTECVQSRADWTGEEIEECWKILVNYSAPIRSWTSFVQGTIEKIRLKKSLKNMKDAGEKCSNSMQKKKTKEELKPKKEETKLVENTNVSTSEKGTKMPLLATFALEMGLTRS